MWFRLVSHCHQGPLLVVLLYKPHENRSSAVGSTFRFRPDRPEGRGSSRAIPARPMNHQHKIDLLSGHQVDITEATRFLEQELHCDDWYVACHHEHQFIIHLTKRSLKQYAVCFECNPPVQKAIYHGSQASSVSIVPLGKALDPSRETVLNMKHGLEELAQGTQPPPHHGFPSSVAAEAAGMDSRVFGAKFKHWLHLP